MGKYSIDTKPNRHLRLLFQDILNVFIFLQNCISIMIVEKWKAHIFMACLFWMGQQQIDFNWIVSKNIESDWPSPRLKLPGFGPRVADRTIFWSVKSRRRSFTQFIIRRSCSFQHFLFRLWYWEQWNNFQIPRLVSVIFFCSKFPDRAQDRIKDCHQQHWPILLGQRVLGYAPRQSTI